jgi:hypothetical protein
VIYDKSSQGETARRRNLPFFHVLGNRVSRGGGGECQMNESSFLSRLGQPSFSNFLSAHLLPPSQRDLWILRRSCSPRLTMSSSLDSFRPVLSLSSSADPFFLFLPVQVHVRKPLDQHSNLLTNACYVFHIEVKFWTVSNKASKRALASLHVGTANSCFGVSEMSMAKLIHGIGITTNKNSTVPSVVLVGD